MDRDDLKIDSVEIPDVDRPDRKSLFQKALGFFKKLIGKSNTWYRRLKDGKWLKIEGQTIDVVDELDVPEKERREQRPRHGYDTSPEKDYGKMARAEAVDGLSPEKVAEYATENHRIMEDILEDPGLLEAGSEAEAVAKIASENPGWAKLSDLPSAYDVDVGADVDVDASDASLTDLEAEAAGDVEVHAEADGPASGMDTGDISNGDINGGDI